MNSEKYHVLFILNSVFSLDINQSFKKFIFNIAKMFKVFFFFSEWKIVYFWMNFFSRLKKITRYVFTFHFNEKKSEYRDHIPVSISSHP